MSIGPLQTIAFLFKDRDLPDEVARELFFLRQQGTIRVVDAVFIEKDVHEKLQIFAVSDLNQQEAKDFITAMLKDNLPSSADVGKIGIEEMDVIAIREKYFIPFEDVETVLGYVPPGSSAMIALVEHRWAERLQETIEQANGSMLAEKFIPNSSIEFWGTSLIESIK